MAQTTSQKKLAFQLFGEGKKPSQISNRVSLKEQTLLRYFQEWKRLKGKEGGTRTKGQTVVETAKTKPVAGGTAAKRSVETIRRVSPRTSLPDKYILIDDTKCSNCMFCMLACSLAHEGKTSLSLSRIQMIADPLGKFPFDVVHKWNHDRSATPQCDFCVEAPYWDGDEVACATVCPMGAITVTTESPI
ncbi:MAG: hypothetical protein PHU08_04275 [Dehalococcoidales bacterium]|nr:hypothetical protein [Dehalococcoidales bacterium]